MRKIKAAAITKAVKQLALEANLLISNEIKQTVKHNLKLETSSIGREILNAILKNAKVAKAERLPLCQDTGLAIIFLQIGQDVNIVNGSLQKAINQGVADAYTKGYLRKSVVKSPFERINTKNNTPAIVHYEIVPGDKVKIYLMAKGGGAENKSAVAMLKPSATENDIINFVVDTVKKAGAQACPPLIVGVGIGGNFEYSALLSKKALLRKMNSHNKDPQIAALEKTMLKKVNSTNIGPGGFGGKTTALTVLIETHPCHIAALPVAVNIECHSHRVKEIAL